MEAKKKTSIQLINHTYHLMMSLLQCSDNVVTSVDLKYGCIAISAEQQWKWRLEDNERNKRMAETLIVNTPPGDLTALTLWCLCCCCSIVCAISADIVWIKKDLFQPKKSTYSTRALIWVHFKTVRFFSQSIFSLFSYLKIHNTI